MTSGRGAFSLGGLVLLFLAMASLPVCAAETPERIVSLAPQITEILYALGVDDRIVGVTTFCDYPPAARGKPRVGGMSNPSLETIVSLKPDLVMLTTDGNPRQAEERLSSLGIATHVFRARRIKELPGAIREMGAFLGIDLRAESLASTLEAEINHFEIAGTRYGGQNRPRRAVFVVWPEPLVVAGPGTAIDDAFEILDLENVAADTNLMYPKYSVEEILLRRPDVIFIGAMNGDIRETSRRFLARLSSLDAVRKNKVYYPGDSLYRLGPRVIDGIRELQSMLGQGEAH